MEVEESLTSLFYLEMYLEDIIMGYNKETGMYEGYIYCVENLINGKKYIGYTKNDIQTRWEQHLSKTHHKEDHSILHIAIDKYKECNFQIYPIRVLECVTLDELIEHMKLAERECVKTYNTLAPNGYNILQGGESVPINRITPIYQYTMDGGYIQSFHSLTEAIQKNGFDDSPKCGKIFHCLRNDHCAFGYLWDRTLNENIKDLYLQYNQNKYKRKNRGKIIQFDMQMNVINSYSSLSEAAEQTGLPRSSIYYACVSLDKTSHIYAGYIWMYEHEHINT